MYVSNVPNLSPHHRHLLGKGRFVKTLVSLHIANMKYLQLFTNKINQIKIGFINVWSKSDYTVSLVLNTRKQKEIMEKRTQKPLRIHEGSPVDVQWGTNCMETQLYFYFCIKFHNQPNDNTGTLFCFNMIDTVYNINLANQLKMIHININRLNN